MAIPHRLAHHLPLLALTLSACGGDGDSAAFVDPDSVTFSYGTGQDASDASAPGTLADLLGEAQAEASAPSEGAAAYGRASRIMSMPQDVAVQAFLDPEDEPPSTGSAVPSCVSISPRGLRWSCSETTAGEGWIADGGFDRSSTALVWDVSWRSEGTDADGRAQVRSWARGSLRVESGHVMGRARVDLEGQYWAPDHVVSAYTTNVDVDLWLDEEGCPRAGTVEVKLLWAAAPFESDRDEGVRYSWSGCGVVNAAFASR